MSQILIDYGGKIGIYLKGPYIWGIIGMLGFALLSGIILYVAYRIDVRKEEKEELEEKKLKQEGITLPLTPEQLEMSLKIVDSLCGVQHIGVETKNKNGKSGAKQPLLQSKSTNLKSLRSGIYNPLISHNLTAVSSFSLYFGQFSEPFTKDQIRILESYELLVVDGKMKCSFSRVKRAFRGKYFLTVYDLKVPSKILDIHGPHSQPNINLFCLSVLNDIIDLLNNNIGNDGRAIFDGIMFTGLENLVFPTLIQPISKLLAVNGVLLFLQLFPPHYLSGKLPDLKYIHGLILTNVTLSKECERRDYFDMAPSVHNMVRAYTDQVTYRQDFTCCVLELIKSEHFYKLTPAKVTRFNKFTQYYKLLPWISEDKAMYSAHLNTPLIRSQNALEFIIRAPYQRVQSYWRSHKVYIMTVATPMTSFNIDPWTRILRNINVLNMRIPSTIKVDESGTTGRLVECHANFEYLESNCPGQFNYGTLPSIEDYDAVVEAQKDLRKRNMLAKVSDELMNEAISILKSFRSSSNRLNHGSIESIKSQYTRTTTALTQTLCTMHIRELVKLIKSKDIQVWHGLDTGFRHNEQHFWSVFEKFDEESVQKRRPRIIFADSEPKIFIYISLKHPSIAEALISTFLSYKGYAPHECVEAETWLPTVPLTKKQVNDTSAPSHTDKCPNQSQIQGHLPLRIAKQFDLATTAELLTFYHQSQRQRSNIDKLVFRECRRRLIDDIEIQKLIELHSMDLMTGKLTMLDYLKIKFGWYHDLVKSKNESIDDVVTNICYLFDINALVDLHREIDEIVHKAFLRPSFPDSATQILELLLQEFENSRSANQGYVEAALDILATMFFAACKRHAFEEVTNITNDFNPMPAREPDQQGLMAELYTLGSRCEEFFDISIYKLSEILYEQRMTWLQKNPPQEEAYSDRRFMLTYLPLVQCGEDFSKPRNRIVVQELAAGLVFAIPAIIDLILLMITGNGTFVNVTMSQLEQTMISSALLMTLLLTGFLSPLIASAGSYYLYLFQFPTMSAILLQQFAASLSFIWGVALIGAIVITVTQTGYGALVFIYYMFVYSTYFLCLATLATMYTDGISISSGRKGIWLTFPMAIGWWPISFFTDLGQNTLLLHAVFWCFYTCLWLFMTRYYLRKFVGWLDGVVQTNEKEILEWYVNNYGEPSLLEMSNRRENWKKEIARKKLALLIENERKKLFFQAKTKDPLVSKLAAGYGPTRYLLTWHALHQGYDMPPDFGVEWNLNVKLALADMRKFNKASKLNRPRLMYHWSKGEAGYGLAYLLLLLMDRWIVLFSGDPLLGMLTIQNPQYGIASGAGILFFLITVTLMDFIAKNIWKKINNMPQYPFASKNELKQVLVRRMNFQKRQYFKYLKLLSSLGFLVWGIMILFLWIFTNSWESVIVFGVLSISYCGLIWAVYCKVFTPTGSATAIWACLFSAVVGLVVGIPLHKLFPNKYVEQGTFAVTAWMAGCLSWYGVVWNYKDEQDLLDRPNLTTGQHCIGKSPALSGVDSEKYIKGFLIDACVEVKPNDALGKRVLQRFESKISFLSKVFADQSSILDHTRILWEKEDIKIYLVPEGRLIMEDGKGYSALPYLDKIFGKLYIYVGVSKDIWPNMRLDSLIGDDVVIQRLCEALIHEVLENTFKYRHCEAVVGELLFSNPNRSDWAIPRRIQSELERLNLSQLLDIMKNTRAQVVKHLLYNLDVDQIWQDLSYSTRKNLLYRLTGKSSITVLSQQEILYYSGSNLDFDQVDAIADILLLMTVLIFSKLSDIRQGIEDGNRTPALPAGGISLERRSLNPYEHTRRLNLSKIISYTLDTLGRLTYSLLSGDAYLPRELYELTLNSPSILKVPGVWIFAMINKFYRGIFFTIVANMIWAENPVLSILIDATSQAIKRVGSESLKYMQVHNPLAPETGFIESSSPLVIHQFKGIVKKNPDNKKQITIISEYSKHKQLIKQTFMKNGQAQDVVVYYYESASSMFPTSKEIMNDKKTSCKEIYYYDPKSGYVINGHTVRGDLTFKINFAYADPIEQQELLEVHYETDDMKITACFHIPSGKSIKNFIPTTNVQRVIYTKGDETYEVVWDYSKKRHPVIVTFDAEGYEVETPRFIVNDTFKILKKPRRLFFSEEDLFFYEFKGPRSKKIKPLKFSTRKARTALWKIWFSTNHIDGVWARMIDEYLLRKEPLLKTYWKMRDRGNVLDAIRYLEASEDQVAAAMYLDDDISSKTHFALKMADLYLAGQGGDAFVSSLRPTNRIPKTPEQVQIYGLQTGTWPAANGGVSNCVRDLVDNLKSVRWNILSETGNDMELIVGSFQIEENINSVCLLPLWGFDWLDHAHNFTSSKTDYEIESRIIRTDEISVIQFISILRRLVFFCNLQTYSRTEIDAAIRVFMDYYDFFQVYDYSVWNDKKVRLAFIELWTSSTPSDAVPIEKPTIGSILSNMEFIKRSLFCLTVAMPENAPDMIQATHHAVGAVYGVLIKIRLGCALHIWDHGVLWREYLSQWSGAQSRFRPSVYNIMVKLVRLTATIALNSADAVLPCTSISNPNWETERATAHGKVEHRNIVRRRIDPLVNGISNMDHYEPDPSLELPNPTVVMLSHVVATKDIKNALLSWDVIINQFGLRGLHLDIYGSTDKLPWYTVECETLLTTLNLKDNVKLRGFGDAKTVLKSAWLVLNSSMTEGLPLALGEAGLSGQPIVCTEAGGSREVIMGDGGHIFGKTANPGSPYDLALGQVAVLGLFDGLEDIAEGRDPSPDAVRLADYIAAKKFKEIHERIMAMKENRRKLGLRLRELVQKKFSGDRYLREHEQMLWIGKYMTKIEVEHRYINEVRDEEAYQIE